MTKRWRRFLVAVAFACGAIVAALAAARALAPGWLRGTIERAASEALCRELKIAGAFELSLSMTPTLMASDITLANAPWGSEPAMVHVGRIRISVDLASVWSGPVRIPDLAVDDVRVLLERDRDGTPNWAFATKPKGAPSTETSKKPLVVIEQAAVHGFELIARARPGARPLTAGISTLHARLDPATKMIEVRGAGHFNDDPWDVAGRLGPLESLYEGRDLDQALTGHIGQSSLTLSGRIRDPLTLGGPNVEAKVEGPDIASALANFGLTSPLTGAFRLEARLAPADDGVNVDADCAVGGVNGSVRGTVGALLRPERIDARVEAKGPDAAVIGTWTGLHGLPSRSFDVAGRLRRDGARLSFDELKVHVGGTSLTVGGTLGELPRCVGMDLKVAATGSDLSELSELTRLRLPTGAFNVSGRLLRRADGLAIDGVTLKTAGSEIHASGTIGQPPELANLDLTADGEGPDVSWLSGIATIELPPEPFEVRGRVARKGPALELDDVEGRLGENTFAVNGSLVPVRGLVGTAAHVKLSGRSLKDAASFAGVHDLPPQTYDAVGGVRIAADHYELDDVDATVGGLTVRADGNVGAPTPRNGTSLTIRGRGAALSDLAAWGVPLQRFSDPFAVSGRLQIEGGVYRVDDLTAEAGADHLAVDGTLGSLPDVSTLDVAVNASGPSLAALARFLDAAPSERIPAEPYTVTGRTRRVPLGVELQGAQLEVGNASVSGDGTIGAAAGGLGTDVRLEVEARDTSMLTKLTGVPMPEGSVRAHGRIRRVESGLQLEDTAITLGPSYAELSGLLGEPPKFSGTDLDLRVEGPDLAAALGPPTGLAPLPAESFALSTHVHGSTERFDSERLVARLGSDDLEGSVGVRLEGRPFIDADLYSRHLDIGRLIAGFSKSATADEPGAAQATKARDKRDRLIPDEPLSLGPLRAVDGRLQVSAAEVVFPVVTIGNVEIAGELRDGAVTIDRFQGTGENGGRATASLSVVPKGDGYVIHTEGRLDGGRIDLAKTGESPKLAPSLDVEYTLDGEGRSLHELAASADGRLLVMLGPGRIPNSLGEFMSSGVLLALADALNPFRKSSPYTALECGIAAAGIDDGKMVVQPIAARSDKMTVLGSGKLDLDTEHIDLVWTIKPRRGVGISGGSIANPYIKLGGTLASPSLDLKPIEAITSTGAAVVTLGATILLRGIYDRITAEKKVCVEALAKARKQMGEHPGGMISAP